VTTRPVVLIIGAAGQDGSIAAERLAGESVEVHAVVRVPLSAGHRLHVLPESHRHVVDITDASSVRKLIDEVQPTQVLNLAGQSDVRESWSRAGSALAANTEGFLNVLEAVRDLRMTETVRIVQASSSEIFGKPEAVPQNERTPLRPVTPYGVTKAAAHLFAQMFRESHNIWVSTAILYNHESSYRPESFVVRHVTASVARIKCGVEAKIKIGDLSARRDWGFAPDYVDGMLRILEHGVADDFVLATGVSHSVEDLLRVAFEHAQISDWERRVETDAARLREVDPIRLVGDATKARVDVGWQPSHTFEQMIGAMVDEDIRRLHAGSGTVPREMS